MYTVIVGVAVGLVMLIALRPSSSAAVKTQFGNIVMLLMILLHAGLGVGFKVYSSYIVMYSVIVMMVNTLQIYYIHSGFYYSVSSSSDSDSNNDTSPTTMILPSLS